MIRRRKRETPPPEPSEEARRLVQKVARWIVLQGGSSAFSSRQGDVVSTPFSGCSVEVCIAGDERQTFHVLYPSTIATIVFSLEVGGSSHYLETKWPSA